MPIRRRMSVFGPNLSSGGDTLMVIDVDFWKPLRNTPPQHVYFLVGMRDDAEVD